MCCATSLYRISNATSTTLDIQGQLETCWGMKSSERRKAIKHISSRECAVDEIVFI